MMRSKKPRAWRRAGRAESRSRPAYPTIRRACECREEDFRLLSQPLDARPAGGERVGFVALRAKMRPAFRHGRNDGKQAMRGTRYSTSQVEQVEHSDRCPQLQPPA